jgi:predicted permease
VRVYATTQPPGMREFTTSGFGYVTYDLLRRGSQTLDGVATYAINDVVLGGGSDARSVKVAYASADLFPLLGVQPARGRFFTAIEDATTGASRVVVLSDGAWKSWLGGAADALGRTLVLGGETFTVVGVAPPGFTGPQFNRVDAWIPGSLFGARITANWTTAWGAQWLQIVGRLKPGVTFEQAGLDATAIHRRGYTGDDVTDRTARFTVASLRANESGAESMDVRILRWLTGVSALVLLIACANIANLLLARGLRRSREVAIRAALGAGRLRLVRLLLLESLLLAAGGAVLGLGVAYQLGSAARSLLFPAVEWTAAPVNVRMLAASMAIAIVTGLLMGIVPALRSTRARLTDALKTGAREGGGRRSALRSGLTVAQAALSVVLLVGAGLFVHSLWKAYTIDFGFDPDRVTVIEITRSNVGQFPEGSARDAERARRRMFYADVLERVRHVPGVERASIANGMPFGNRFSLELRASEAPTIPRLPGGGPGLSAVSHGYFETMGTAVMQGRAFTSADGAGTEPVAIVSRLMAETIWPGRDPLNKCLYIGVGTPGPPPVPPPCARVVGVAQNTYRSRLREDPVMHYYIPAGQEVGFGGAVLLVRTSDTSGATMAAVRTLLTDLDSTIRYVRADTIRARIDPQMRPWKLGATVFAVSGLLALVVAAIGMYSVLSYLIAGRRHEIGVRLALGARTSDILRLVFGNSVAMAVAGVVIGEAIAVSLGGFVAPLLFATSPRDPIVFVGVGVVLVTVALLATLGPARLARRVSAMEALRVE